MTVNSIQSTKQYQELMMKYNAGLNLALNIINTLLEERNFYTDEIIVDHIKSRIKTFDSATNKLIKRNYEVSCSNIKDHVHDMAGIRIICPFLSDVYKVVKMLKKNDVLIIKEEKNYIDKPKESGYRSYHLLVWVPVSFLNKTENIEVEIQIRTLAMDFWASLDHEIRYKFEGDVPDTISKQMETISKDMNHLDSKMLKLNNIMKDYKEDKY
jgi:putative GTP pyrophosphokinase